MDFKSNGCLLFKVSRNEPGEPTHRLQMKWLSLRNHRLKLKTSGKLLTILEGSMEYTPNQGRKPKRSQHVTWKHTDFEIMPKNLPRAVARGGWTLPLQQYMNPNLGIAE